ncbi:hypothetical protein AgCh_020602 [Apium graveolens]
MAQEARKYKDDKAKKEAEKEPECTIRRHAREARDHPYFEVHNLNGRPSRNFGGEADDITFTKADAEHVHHPHNDALVITIFINNLNIHMVLVDNDSSYNILSYATYQKKGVLDKEMSPAYNELYGFIGGPVKSGLNWKSILILKSGLKISELKLSKLKLSGDIYQEIISGLKETFR